MLRPEEAASLRPVLAKLASDAQGDLDRLAYAAVRLRALLTGFGWSPAYIDEAARLLIDEHMPVVGEGQ